VLLSAGRRIQTPRAYRSESPWQAGASAPHPFAHRRARMRCRYVADAAEVDRMGNANATGSDRSARGSDEEETSMWKKALAIFVAGVAAVVVLAVPGAANADPGSGITCGGSGCDYADPYATNCYVSGQVIYQETNLQNIYIRLWYSWACETVWAETNAYSRSIKVDGYWPNGSYRATASSFTGTLFYSPMLYDGDQRLGRACLKEAFDWWRCTGLW
jgi:hypothetical protein